MSESASAYEFEPHRWKGKRIRGMGSDVCSRRGLVALRNPLTAWSIEKGCESELHPAWARVRVELVRKHQDART